MSRIWIYALALSIVACTIGEQNNMNAQADPIEKFKTDIGFNQIAEGGGPDAGVVVEWPAPDTSPALAGMDWIVESKDVEFRDNGAEGEWILKKDDETILLRIFVSSMGTEPARQRLIDIASSTMMMDIPFKKSAQPIGTLSVTIPGASDGTYIWVFHNICFYLRGIDTEADLEALAEWLQAIGKSGLVKNLSAHLPAIKSLKVDPPVVPVGGTFSVLGTLDGGSNFDAKDYSYDFRHNEQALDLEDEEGSEARFTTQIPGDANIAMCVVDHKTLLSNCLTGNVKVVK